MTHEHQREVLGIRQAAAYLGIVRDQLLHVSHSGQLGKHVAGVWVYSRAELDRWRREWRSSRQLASPSSVPIRSATAGVPVVTSDGLTSDQAWLLQILTDTSCRSLTIRGWMTPVAADCHAQGWIRHLARQHWQITPAGRAMLAMHKQKMTRRAHIIDRSWS